MRDFSKAKRIVIKVGTNLLTTSEGVNNERIRDIVDQVARIREMGHQVILVSSGAVWLGAKALKHNSPVVHIAMRQACASIGQPILMASYQEEFSRHNLICSQVLITRSVLSNRTSYKNLRSTVSTLLALGVVPIFNENDVVSTAEIGNVFGDNDRMSALVASKIDADLLILLTDIDGLYTGNPKKEKNAKMIKDIPQLTDEIFSFAKGAGNIFSTGGMKTKLLAAQIAQKGGCGTIIASGYEDNALVRIIEGEELGSYVFPEERIAQRERWILNTPARGKIFVDEGAKDALLMHKSLLPTGIKHIDGVFDKGDVVSVEVEGEKAFMKAITNFNSTDLTLLQGHKSSDIESLVGKGKKDVVFRPEDSAVIEDEQL